MPPTGANTKVKDPEYCNWLKVGLALYYLKVGLCSFIQDEVDAMHQFLIQKLYKGSAVPASQCSSCNAKNVKQNRNSYTWKFRCPCPSSLCDTWLIELLALHTNPTTNKLYCENCDVTAWPHASWECAKLYMPRGQPSTNTSPAQSDSQALLTLMANCKYFHNKLSQGGIQLTHMVSTIRNRVMHSGDMRLSDNDRTSFIQDIIKLLEDPNHLKSLKECKQAVAEINKINNDSLDVFFNIDLEMKALRECVNDYRQELGIHKVETDKTVDSLKEELKECVNDYRQELGIHKVETEKTVDSLKEELRDLNIKFEYFEKEMQLIKESTSQTSRASADVRDIQLLLIKAYESVQIISINPVFDTAVNWKDLEDFYTDVVIEEDEEEEEEEEDEEEEEEEEEEYEQQDNEEKIKSFRQIFKKYDKKVTRIILKAPAGQGKSTFCRKLVNTWCSVQKKQLNILIDDGISDKSEASGLKDEDELLRFDVLLYICFRYISDEKTLMDVVYTQFPLHESQGLSHRSHIEALIAQAEDNKVLLIMDGLDEMDNSSTFIDKIMQRRLYAHLTVLATTRPWKIGQLSLIRSAHIDLFLNLQGFSYGNSMLFAKRIFDKYYKNESAFAAFEQNIQENFVIRSLIHVPLLLLFVVHVWYERKSFPQTIHELYLEMLNVIVNRYMENKERKEKGKEGQDDKKYIWPLETMTFNVTPKLADLSLVQCFGEGFLAALCEVANNFLITDAKETNLVFEEKALLKLLGRDGSLKLQTALDMGILSKSESPGIFRKKINLTFLHKTVQEFLAAINISCREDRCNNFLDSLNTLDDLFQNEIVIKIVAGISPSHCQKIFDKIYGMIDKNRALIPNSMHVLHRLYRDCIREACGEPLVLKLYCMDAYNQDEWNVLLSAVLNVIIHLRWLKLHSCTLDDATLDFSESNSLEFLCLVGVTMKGKPLPSKCTQLKHLQLQKCSLDDDSLDLSKCTSLTHLRLIDMTMKGKLLLSTYTQLRCLRLHNCILDDDTLDVSKCIGLTNLRLENVIMNGKLSLSKYSHLKYLKLWNCNLDDDTLDLSESDSLKLLSLEGVAMKGKLLPLKCTHLKWLKLYNCRLDDATLDFSESNCLEFLSLVGVTMKGKLLLSKCTQLKCLKLQKNCLDDTTLDLSESIRLRYARLKNVTMKDKLLLSRCTQLRSLKLIDCTLTDATLDLSESICLIYVRLENVTMKGKLLLSKCTHLMRLKQDGFTLDDATLDLSESSCLKLFLCSKTTQTSNTRLLNCAQSKRLMVVKWCLGEFTMGLSTSISQIKRIHHDESQCNQIQILSVKNAHLGDALLSLDSVNDLNVLCLDNVTMSKECKEVFCNSMSQCKQLYRLSVKNVDLCDALLSLVSVEYLNELNLVNVEMDKISKVLCKYLSKCTQLSRLSIKNVDMCDVPLNLDKMEKPYHLTIDNVTMCKSGYVMLCKSISTCKTLTSLLLKNLDMLDGLLSLDMAEKLHHLTIDNVTMYKNGYLMLCNSISTCKTLTSLSVKNVDLCDALLNLDKAKKTLYHLSIENVSMCKNGYVMLCNSISTC